MKSNFWHERWQRGEIGFHRPDIHWALERNWAAIAQGRSGAVLVPLCGKSLDMHWLARAGHEVVGIELSRKAIREFYEEWDKKATQTPAGALNRWQADGVALLEGDFFAYRPETPFELFYDRAALVALPTSMRTDYLDHLRSLLASDAQGLLVTFEYAPAQMDGPPFSVPETELHAHPGLAFELIERRDTLGAHPGFAKRGLSALRECAWRVSVI